MQNSGMQGENRVSTVRRSLCGDGSVLCVDGQRLSSYRLEIVYIRHAFLWLSNTMVNLGSQDATDKSPII
jgi:hypothetical protein